MPLISTIPRTRYDNLVQVNEDYDSVSIERIKVSVPARGDSVYINGHSKIVNECQLEESTIIGTLSSLGTIDGFLQVFRASTDNIHDLRMFLRGAALDTGATTLASCDDLTGWASSSPKTVLSTEITDPLPVHGTGALAISVENPKSDGSYITKTLATPLDISNHTNITFHLSSLFGHTLRFEIVDGNSNRASYDWICNSSGEWFERDIVIENMTGVSIVDLTNITSIVITVIDCVETTSFYLDDIRALGTVGESIVANVSIYDFGSLAEPTSLDDGTILTLDDGSTFTSNELTTYKRIETVHIHLGSLDIDNTIEVGNYYGIYIQKPAAGSIEVYGSPTQNYISGKFKRKDEGVSTLVDETSSLGFIVTSIRPTLLKEIIIHADGPASGTTVYAMAINPQKKLQDMIAVSEFLSNEDKELRHNFDPLYTAEYIELDKDSFLVFYFQYGIASQNSEFEIIVRHLFKKIDTWG